MDLDTSEMINARAAKHPASLLALALVEVYDAFLEGSTREQAVGVLTHRGVGNVVAARIYELVQQLSA